jgi:hypothetical protein
MNTIADVSVSQECGYDMRPHEVSRDPQDERLADLCFALLFEIMIEKGCAVAQAVSRWLSTSSARVRIRAACGVCDGQIGVVACFLRVLRFPLLIILPVFPSSYSPGAGTIGHWWPQCRVDPIGLYLPRHQLKIMIGKTNLELFWDPFKLWKSSAYYLYYLL